MKHEAQALPLFDEDRQRPLADRLRPRWRVFRARVRELQNSRISLRGTLGQVGAA
ncbi:hypothetical protein [Streptomyces griseiscabiei]|uniref:Uncharacterized protein n=1 Tax=Streptomyces griseiscabiei TaxID=2993540 RepID=A0ABU4L492_9ACTN|nr:hypothetical protein [Streptomyces griseiscabiei]MBZ3905437.1 hypothetical protein [Streptomyces griseiscabiei]MDX2910527.1 hypothetical protein [Streptomyces griseiscabiei]